MTPEGDGAALSTDLSLGMAAAGLRGTLVDGGGEGLTLTGKTDAMAVRTESDAVRGPDGNLAAAQATVTRLRLGLEGRFDRALDVGGTLTPSLEVGVRHDGGDAETGAGLELGGGLAYADPASGLSMELRGRTLVGARGRRLPGMGRVGLVRPRAGRGRARAVGQLTPAYGVDSGGADGLWDRRRRSAGGPCGER